MSAEEKARKLAEMSGNAVLHDAQRESRVKKGREKEAREDAQNEGNKNDHSFYRKIEREETSNISCSGLNFGVNLVKNIFFCFYAYF